MDAHLADINMGRLRAPADDPVVAEFVDALDHIALAESGPGFVWRYRTDAGNALAERPYADPLIILNLSVWTSPDAVRDFTIDRHTRRSMRSASHTSSRQQSPSRLDLWPPHTIGVESLAHGFATMGGVAGATN